MKAFETFLNILNAEMEVPKPFGIYHLFCWLVVIVLTIYLCIFQRNISPEKLQKTIFFISLTKFILEIYRHIHFGLSIQDNKIIFEYPWYAFPWQFCSTPMYAEMLSCIVKKGKLHDSLYAFLATYVVFAGFCVMFYPNGVFTNFVGVNIETMFCHGSMVILGIWLLAAEKVKLEHKTLLKALPVFLFVVAAAVIMNEVAFFNGILEKQNFNMFYINPHCTPTLFLYALVQSFVPYPWFILVYSAVFTLGAYLILLLAIFIKNLVSKYTTTSLNALTQ